MILHIFQAQCVLENSYTYTNKRPVHMQWCDVVYVCMFSKYLHKAFGDVSY